MSENGKEKAPKLVQTKLDPVVARWVEKQAREEGLSVAAWVRRLLMREKKAQEKAHETLRLASTPLKGVVK